MKYIRIKKCYSRFDRRFLLTEKKSVQPIHLFDTKEHCWYANKIGHIFKVDEGVSFENYYIIRTSRKRKKSKYGIVFISDAEIIKPTFFQKIKTMFKWEI